MAVDVSISAQRNYLFGSVSGVRLLNLNATHLAILTVTFNIFTIKKYFKKRAIYIHIYIYYVYDFKSKKNIKIKS